MEPKNLCLWIFSSLSVLEVAEKLSFNLALWRFSLSYFQNFIFGSLSNITVFDKRLHLVSLSFSENLEEY